MFSIKDIIPFICLYFLNFNLFQLIKKKGSFWERMELNDFPLDIQELSICLTTKHSPKLCKLTAETKKLIDFDDKKCSILSSQVLNSFRDQQKFNVTI